MNDIYKQFKEISEGMENLSKVILYKKLIDVLQEEKEGSADEMAYDFIFDALKDAIKYRTKRELEGKTEEGWTPTSIKMPPEGTYIITGKYGKNRYIDIAYYNHGWDSYSDEYKIHPEMHEVIAWMELPEAYKGDDKT